MPDRGRVARLAALHARAQDRRHGTRAGDRRRFPRERHGTCAVGRGQATSPSPPGAIQLRPRRLARRAGRAAARRRARRFTPPPWRRRSSSCRCCSRRWRRRTSWCRSRSRFRTPGSPPRRAPLRRSRRSPRPSSRRWKKRSSPGMPSSSPSCGKSRPTARTARCAGASSRCSWTAATSSPPCCRAMSQAQGDPLRALFLETWSELRAILDARILARRRATRSSSMPRDALAALETAAPGLPLSADGLRQLARSLRPGRNRRSARLRLGARPRSSASCSKSRRFREAEPTPAPAAAQLAGFLHFRRACATTRSTIGCRRAQELAGYGSRVGERAAQDRGERSAARAAGRALRPDLSLPRSHHRADRELLAPVRGARRQGDLPALAVEQRGHHADQPAGLARVLRHRAPALGHRLQHPRRRADPDALPEGLCDPLRREHRQARRRCARRVCRLQRRPARGRPLRQVAAASARSARGREAMDAVPRASPAAGRWISRPAA